ncbi:hypothetical protein EG328_003568 [Venturia inaequalis]|uniref:SUZ domain-containing protein n=1 Tax=Venturia inaequalis TaxID=5025 RepID=A0A8H3UT71_VENIN|nr:hypothetical protein EG328_003568 [Venturia inaequalis]KAE9987367.1 hypothetical protein EG327_003849 [Venturia inaequalis]RDI81988.1 hypothetical protein Vi05172_g8026 [Venturia inaequalis]
MSTKKAVIPSAWDDDDWEAQADKEAAAPPTEVPVVKLSRAERKAKHDEANKQLWDAAEAPEKPIFLLAREDVPLKDEFKGPLKVLSRKPPPKVIARQDPTSGLANLNMDDDDDSEEEERKKAEKSFLERQARAKIEREEKQRKYQEARDRIMGGKASNDASGRPSSAHGSGSRNSSRGKGRSGRVNATPSAEPSPARASRQSKGLYDPGYTPKPGSVYLQKRDGGDSSASGSSKPNEDKPMRAPKGPDSSGKAGFGKALFPVEKLIDS